MSLELAHSNLKNGFLASKQTDMPFGIELALVTEHVQEVVHKALELGAIIVENPIEKPWGQIVCYIRDLDGFLLEICAPIKQ